VAGSRFSDIIIQPSLGNQMSAMPGRYFLKRGAGANRHLLLQTGGDEMESHR
jgi:hypothetical protein